MKAKSPKRDRVTVEESAAAQEVIALIVAGPHPRKVCPWHLVDLAEDAGELRCRVGRGHWPRSWLVVDGQERVLAVGRDTNLSPHVVVLNPPLRLTDYLRQVWLPLCWPRQTFGQGARQARIPVARRREIVARKSALFRDTKGGRRAA